MSTHGISARENAVASPRRRGLACALQRALPALLLVAPIGAWSQTPAHPARRLVIQVRDAAPASRPAFHRGRDNSYTVATGNGADRDDRADAPGNGTSLSTTAGVRLLHVREGERVRVDLPTVQSLQFHVPISTPGAPGKANAASPASAAAAAPGSASAGPSTSGVVYFNAVAAFSARFALAGPDVRIELTPVRTGTVAAPLIAAGAPGENVVRLVGRVGEWIALGDPEVQTGGKSLSPTAEPPSPASVWVRVDPETADQP